MGYSSVSIAVEEPVAAGPGVPEPARRVVVAGGGPVGVRAAQELVRRGHHVVLVNAERWRPYNRVKLTPLLAGEAQIGQVYLSETFDGPGQFDRYDGVSVVDIDREQRIVHLSTGRQLPYERLVLALGSRAFVPGIPGTGLSGVFVFRDFDDAEALLARSLSARSVVVIGGGLLGLEAARGMRRRGAKVTVLEHEHRLMPRQLDAAAGAVLKARIEELGVRVITGTPVKSIDGNDRVTGVTLGSGETVAADTVIVCTGVRANIQLAQAVGLKVGRGIVVDDRMCTSDPAILAVGECAEHNGIVHGLVGPGFEQAQAAVAAIDDEQAPYRGSTPATRLKVLGADVFSIGDFESAAQQPGVTSVSWQSQDGSQFRRIFLERGRLVAALGVGPWPEATRLQQAVMRRQPVGFWRVAAYPRTGRLWAEEPDSVVAWPKQAIVCNCTGATKGAICDAVAAGACSIEAVRSQTGANTVCGTCAPLVQELIGGTAPPEPARWWKWLVGLSGAAALVMLAIAFLPRIPLADSFRPHELFFDLWFNSIWKQWSGFSLLGLTAAAALLGLRKRIGIARWLGNYQGWRLVHLGIGGLAALALVWHTGFRLGANLNLVLMLCFLVTLAFGAVAGLITGGEHELRGRDLVTGPKSPRTLPLWVHILALWPLPVLIVLHVLAVYTY
ncbi:MAG: FAD-dependent oxidoreductase [Pseudomonadota bacterium]|nr:FAD-dependent oxidoreductase [Pseudomonadota bacterium]